MNYLLDTNVCIYYFKGKYGLKEKVEKIGYDYFYISEITLAELVYGAEKSQRPTQNLKTVDNFLEKIQVLPIFDSIKVYGKEKARLKTKGKIIDNLDLFIGATAIVNDMVLITRNIKHFERMENLKIENWVDDK